MPDSHPAGGGGGETTRVFILNKRPAAAKF
jgi:hypothetical protein